MTEKRPFNLRKLILGLFMVVLGVLAPFLLPAKLFRISETIDMAIRTNQSIYLLVAALKLVVLNTIRSFPHYLGAFFLMDSIAFEKRLHQLLKNILISIFAVGLVYSLIERIYGIHYDFAVPSVLMISVLLIVDRMDFSMVRMYKKATLLSMLILAIQFLDVLPIISSEYFGRGELSSSIKMLVDLMGASNLLSGMCIIFMGLFFLFTALLCWQISLENELRRANHKVEEERENLMDTRMRLLEARTNKEQQFLVHDLKAPLTSIQIWTDLLRMKACNESCADCKGYLDHIDGSARHMNLLVSEIMNSKTRSVFTVDEVIKLFSSQTSPTRYNDILTIENTCGVCRMEINRTNFVRALINLTENAANSIHHNHGAIMLRVSANERTVYFTVTDNGEGIAPEMLDKIWEKGVSGRGSTGVGLFFVKEVVNDIGGDVTIDSAPSRGTRVTVCVPRYYSM